MANTDARATTGEVYQDATDERGEGWLFFAGTMLGVAGLMRIIDSIWAFHYNGVLPDNLKDGLFGTREVRRPRALITAEPVVNGV